MHAMPCHASPVGDGRHVTDQKRSESVVGAQAGCSTRTPTRTVVDCRLTTPMTNQSPYAMLFGISRGPRLERHSDVARPPRACSFVLGLGLGPLEAF